ncbi:M48 family metallopeptidase [Streptomyces sp. NPDC019937]|uniref:M48 family metallopeptidase n=1 Tax=Streptomyces sp. NPDC019937 TaxID=3154787 RepID=UPI0033F9BC78
MTGAGMTGAGMTAAARAVLALTLLAGFYALVAVVVLLWVAALVAAVWSAGEPTATTPPTNVIMLCAALAPVVVALLWAVVRTARPAAPRTDAVTVSRRGAPALWAVVEELASAVGTRPPDRVRLTADVNASVTDDAPFLGLAPGGRTLYLGLPLLMGLTPAELRAVLAHELGHFSRRHGRFGVLAHRGTAGLLAARQAIVEAATANNLVRMYAGGPLLLLRLYTRVFAGLTRPVRRRQELEADREAARAAGPRAVADALRAALALEAAWREFTTTHLTPMRRAYGCVPDDPFRAFGHMVDAPELREPLAALRARATEHRADPDDPHPDLATRLARLARLPEGSPPPAEPLSVPSRYAVRLARAAGTPDGTMVPWREWLGLLAEHRATRALAPLAKAVRTVERGAPPPTAELTIHRVLRLLDSGRSMPLARALNGALPPSEVSQDAERDPLGPLSTALAALIGAQLVANGTAYWAMHWTGPGILVPPEGTAPDDIRDWADAAVRQPGQTRRLGLHLAALGVDEHAPLLPGPPAPTRTPAPRTSSAPGTPELGPGTPPEISIAPAVSEPARRRITSVRALALTVLLGLTAVSYGVWANRDEPGYPRVPATAVTPWNQPGDGLTPPPYSPPPYSPLLPNPYATPYPTGALPTAPPPWRTAIPRPSLDIAPLLPRATP